MLKLIFFIAYLLTDLCSGSLWWRCCQDSVTRFPGPGTNKNRTCNVMTASSCPTRHIWRAETYASQNCRTDYWQWFLVKVWMLVELSQPGTETIKEATNFLLRDQMMSVSDNVTKYTIEYWKVRSSIKATPPGCRPRRLFQLSPLQLLHILQLCWLGQQGMVWYV